MDIKLQLGFCDVFYQAQLEGKRRKCFIWNLNIKVILGVLEKDNLRKLKLG